MADLNIEEFFIHFCVIAVQDRIGMKDVLSIYNIPVIKGSFPINFLLSHLLV